MSGIYILIHKPTKEEIIEVSDWLYKNLKRRYTSRVDTYHDGSVISIWGRRIYIELRCGETVDNLSGIWPTYYYTEGDDRVADLLEQGACKVNGRRIKDIVDVLFVVYEFMWSFANIDNWLIESEDSEIDKKKEC